MSAFDEAKKECVAFSWNLLSSIHMLKVISLMNENKDDEKVKEEFNKCIEHHCKYLTNEVSH